MVMESDTVDRAKKAAAIEAAQMAPSGGIIGLGTGSTASYVIEELGRRMRDEGAHFTGIPTSYWSEILAQRQGIPIRTIGDVAKIELAIDGADEVDSNKNLIKGSGGAQTREKIVDSFADYFVVVIDSSKLVKLLGTSAPIPLEVLPSAVKLVEKNIKEMDGTSQLRLAGGRPGHYGPIITEHGNMLLDVRFPIIENPKALESALNNIPGVVENGLFAEKAHLILVGSISDGTISRIG
jgi:ribose 5-phosphate isomerase A